MDKPTRQAELRILLLEDTPTDAELVEDALREAGLSFISKRVDTRDAFIRALEEFKPDIVLADYKLPAFDGGSALKITRQQHPNIPVVIVTGAIGDEAAVELLRLGARDYVLKDRLARLGPAVRRALSEERGIQARKVAEEALRHSEADIKALVEHSPIAMLVDTGVGADEKILTMNKEFTELFGYTMEDVPDVHHWWPLAYPDEKYREEINAEWTVRVKQAIQSHGRIEPMEATVACKDGSNRYVKVSLASIGSRNIITFEDLTERRQAEDTLRLHSAILRNLSEGIILIRASDGVIVFTNPQFERMFDYEPDELLDKHVSILNAPDKKSPEAVAAAIISELAQTGKWNGEVHNIKKGGTTFWCYASILSFEHPEFGKVWVTVHEDITERKRAEMRVQKLTQLYATLSETNHTIVRATNREELFARICENAVIHGKFILAWVGLVDEATRMVKPVCHHGAEAGYLTNIVISTDDVPAGRGPTGTSIRENCVSYVNDYATDERTFPWREAALKRGFCGAAGVPLRFNNKVIGALTLYADEPDFFDAEQLDLLEEMATDIGFALDNFAREAERKNTEAKLAENERHFRAVTESANDAIVTAAGTGNIVGWNAAAERLFGYTETEIIGQPIAVLMPERFRNLHSAGLARVVAGGAPHVIGKTVELAGLRKGGSEFPLELSLAQWQAAGGQFFTAIIRDITGRKLAEETLRENEEIFRRFVEYSPIYVFLKDKDMRVLRLSKNFETMLGKPLVELLGKTLDEFFPPKFANSMIVDDIKTFANGKEITVEEEFNGRTYSITKFPIFLEGKPHYLAGYIVDITEHKRFEAQQLMEYQQIAGINAQLMEANQHLKQVQSQLLQSEKMAAIGLLAAGVAHEINNPIGYVNSNLGTLEKYLADIFAVIDKLEAAETLLGAGNPLLNELREFKAKIDLGYIREDTKALLAESHQGLERVKKIVLDLKEFSHSSIEDQWMLADVQHGLESTLNVVWNELKYKCEVVREYGDLPKINCLPSQLNQVFMNLLVNAAQAIEVRGKITLRTGQEGNRIWVEVSDTGKGIPAENIPRLFDPFFTTKPVGKGTGLGLSVSYKIIEKHHGKIEVQSEVGKGSTFRVWLPVQQPDTKEIT